MSDLDKACDEHRAAAESIATNLKTFKERLGPCEKYYARMNSESTAIIPDMMSSNPFYRYFERIDSMVHKHLPKIYQFYKSLKIK